MYTLWMSVEIDRKGSVILYSTQPTRTDPHPLLERNFDQFRNLLSPCLSPLYNYFHVVCPVGNFSSCLAINRTPLLPVFYNLLHWSTNAFLLLYVVMYYIPFLLSV